jgi:UDP-3-O-[3-hydroxymyristoyl] N-acetylglucosamine deacetylase
LRCCRRGCYGELRPHAHGLRVETEIEFDHPLIGRQTFAIDVQPSAFRRELARARTFGFMRDVTKLWAMGYALGASFENTVVVAENRILSTEGMRFSDEFVRHKAVDAIGDLALAGAPLIGVRSERVDLQRDAGTGAPCPRPCRSCRRLCGAGLRARPLLI